MADILISKQATAQRQIDAAIRWLFNGDDELPIYTVVSAACTVLGDISKKRQRTPFSKIYEATLIRICEEWMKRAPTEEEIVRGIPKLEKVVLEYRHRPANFLKHADRDPNDFLDPTAVRTDELLLEACLLYRDLGLQFTLEMRAFVDWSLLVHRGASSIDQPKAVAAVQALDRDEQLAFGNHLLSCYQLQSLL